MGEKFSKPKGKPEYLQGYLAAMKKKREQVMISKSVQSFNGKAVKELTIDILQQFVSQDALRSYEPGLKSFINKFKDSKFAVFLANFSFLYASEKIIENTAEGGEENNQTDQSKTAKTPHHEKIEYAKPQRASECYKKLKRGTLYEKLFNLLEIEIGKRDNFFFEVANEFGQLFNIKYKKFALPLEKKMSEACVADNVQNTPDLLIKFQNFYKKALKDIKLFRKFLQECMKAFLTQMMVDLNSGDQNTSFTIDEKQLSNLALKMIFTRKACYEMIFNLIRHKNRGEEFQLLKSQDKMSRLNLQAYNIQSYFMLSEQAHPYLEVIETINQLDNILNPYDKLTVISKLRKEMAVCIDDYYERFGDDSATKHEINADTVMQIYCYCMANCGNEKLRSHQLFIEEFVDDSYLKFGEEGYYFSTFVAALDFLVSLSEDPKGDLDASFSRSVHSN